MTGQDVAQSFDSNFKVRLVTNLQQEDIGRRHRYYPGKTRAGIHMPKDTTNGRPKGSLSLPQIHPGKYADGMPYDQLGYLECKIILKPNHFTSRSSLFDFGKLLKRPAKENGISSLR